MSLQILVPGLLTTVQDRGRYGWRHFGVPRSGAADTWSLAIANRLVGRPPGAAALEYCLTGPSIRFARSLDFAIAGGVVEASLNGRPISCHRRYAANPADTLTIGAVLRGCRGYVAFSTPLLIPSVLGSQSTYRPASFGGFEGRALQANDLLPLVDTSTPAPRPSDARPPSDLVPYMSHNWALRVLPGPEFDQLHKSEQSSLFDTAFTVGQRADRMGVQLQGPLIGKDRRADASSSAVFPGTVQAPPGGNPFVLLSDGQTTGGYPRVAQICRADLHVLGQLRPGDQVELQPIDADQAKQLLDTKNALLKRWVGEDVF